MVDYVMDEFSHFVCCGYIKSTTQQRLQCCGRISIVKFSLCIVSNSNYVTIKDLLSLDLGGTSRLQVHENNEVFIKDLATKKCALFMPPCWKHFVGVIADNEEHVQLSLVGKMTHYTHHIGGTWYVLVDIKYLLWTFVVGTKIRGQDRC